MTTETELRYPIGEFAAPATITSEHIEEWIRTIENFPAKIRNAVENLSDEQLDTPYREDGWTIRQVVHHCADSHMNAYIRHKLLLTEYNPTIKPYDEARWAELPDSENLPVEISLGLIDGLHARWVFLLKSISEEKFHRTMYHPEHQKKFSLDSNLGMYAWHCEHHLAHILGLRERMGW